MLDAFKNFMLRGNVIDVAIGFVMGVAFTAVVNSFVADLLTPLIAAFGGQPDFAELTVAVRGNELRYGVFLNAVIALLLTGAVLFYLLVLPVSHLVERHREEPTPDPTTRKCPYCLSEVAFRASRCPFCTSQLEPLSQPELPAGRRTA